MATAKNLDRWEDPGLSFSEEEVGLFDVSTLAEDRVLWLIELQNILFNYWKLTEMGNMGVRLWARVAAKDAKSMAGWTCVAATIPACDPTDFNREDKEFKLAAHGVGDIHEYVGGLITSTSGYLRTNVTLARRASTAFGWNKGQRSQANKYFNAVHNQRERFRGWHAELKKYRTDNI